MYELVSSQRKCKHCWLCETLLNGFITREVGYLRINEIHGDWQDMKAAAESVIAACPNDAITFRKVS